MKKNSITALIVAAVTLLAGIALLCVYTRELRRLFKTFWDAIEAKRANLKLYMQ